MSDPQVEDWRTYGALKGWQYLDGQCGWTDCTWNEAIGAKMAGVAIRPKTHERDPDCDCEQCLC